MLNSGKYSSKFQTENINYQKCRFCSELIVKKSRAATGYTHSGPKRTSWSGEKCKGSPTYAEPKL